MHDSSPKIGYTFGGVFLLTRPHRMEPLMFTLSLLTEEIWQQPYCWRVSFRSSAKESKSSETKAMGQLVHNYHCTLD
jgi:hypothetical protein